MELVGRIASGLSTLLSRARAEGFETLPKQGPAVVAINHTTIADVPLVLAAMYRAGLRPSVPCGGPDCGTSHGHVRFMATSLVFASRLIGPLARHGGMIEVESRAGAAALRAATEALARGEIIGIYPEGDVWAAGDGSPRPFRLGVARLAVAASAPVIPVAHHDARRIGSGSVARAVGGILTAVVRRPVVRLRVGRPIQPSEFAGLPLRDVAELVRSRVTEVWRSLATLPEGSGLPG